MFSIILIIILGLFVAFFAVQNSALVTVNLANYTFAQVPLYAVIIWSFFLGIFLAWLASLVDLLSHTYKMFGKDRKISETKKIAHQLNNRIHELELENAQLKERIKATLPKEPMNRF